MSGLLLDTNIIIQIANSTEGALPKRLREALGSASVSFTTSVVSLWEISIKFAAGKLRLEVQIDALPTLLDSAAIGVLPMSLQHALEIAYPEPATKDPFDRLLLAVCACEGLKLVTTDTRLAGHRLVW